MSDDEDARRMLTEEGQQARLLRLLGSLNQMKLAKNEFLGKRKLADKKVAAKKPKDLSDKKKKFGRTEKEGGRPGTAGDDDRKEDGRRMNFEEMLDKYKKKDVGKDTRTKSTFKDDKLKNDSAYKERMDKLKAKGLDKAPSKDNAEYNKKDAAGKTKYKTDRRKELTKIVEEDYKKKIATYKEKVTKQKKDLQAG